MQLLSLSKCKVESVKSKSYLRLVIILHGFAIYMVCCSQFGLLIKLIATGILLFQIKKIIFNPNLSLQFKKIYFQVGECQLIDNKGHEIIYPKYRVILEAGIFFLLELSGENTRKIVIIFFDQIPQGDFRILRLLEKLC